MNYDSLISIALFPEDRQQGGRKGGYMVSAADTGTPDGPRSPWLGVAKVIIFVLFVITLYLLARSMVTHHFFSGGQMK